MGDLVPLPAQPSDTPWPTSAFPEGEPRGADPDRLEAEVERAFATDDGPLGESLALLIVQDGQLVVERYGTGTDEATTLISWSMAKSILQAAVGVLLAEGRARRDERVRAPEWSDPADPRCAITVSDLLRMRPGLEWVEDYVDDGVSHVIDMLFGAGRADTAAYAAALPLVAEPGERYVYSSGTTNILARFVGERAGGDAAATERFLRTRLFEPIGMRSAQPRFDDAGTFIGSSFVFATARDFARFGLFYLRDGVWDGERILPPGWVDLARTPQGVEDDSIDDYGDHWWVLPCPHGSFRARGYEGQTILCVPGLDLVIVRLAKTPEASGGDPLFLHLAELVGCFADGA